MVGDGGVEPQWAPPGLVLPKAYKTPAGDISQIKMVGNLGFEPRIDGLRVRCLNHLASFPMERETGLEPATSTLATWCSTN